MATPLPSPRGSMPSSFDDDTDFAADNRWSKFKRLVLSDPLIPIGCLLTCGALLSATRAMRRNDHATANKMFRRRIYAQGFTVCAIVLGSGYMSKDKEKVRREKEEAKERGARERREKWLAELDFRDQEDREMRAEMEGRRRGRVERDRLEREVVGEGDGGGGVSEAVKGLMWSKKGEGKDGESNDER